MEVYVEGYGIAHIKLNTEAPVYDYGVVIGEQYDTEEGIVVIYNDGSNQYSRMRGRVNEY